MANTNGRTGNEIAIVGMATRVPGAPTTSTFWENLRNEREALQQFSDEQLLASGVPQRLLDHPDYVKAGMSFEGVEQFDAGFFGLSARDAAIMDPQHRHFLECVWEVLEDSGHPPASFGGAIGVFAGSGHNTYLPYNLLSNQQLLREVGYFLLRHTGNDKDFLTTRASYHFDLRGPSVNVQTACSTSLVAIHLAANSLLAYECDLALAGGVTIAVPHGQGHLFRQHEILSADGRCRPFDQAATGTVFGSGAGLVALRRLEDALDDGDHIYALILGSAVNNDGANKVSYLAPSVDGQVGVMSEALHMAGVESDSVEYVECHGTGTKMGDAIEIAALREAYPDRSSTSMLRLGSVKSNIGHLDTAAGVAGVIKVALAMTHEEIPATLHFETPNPELGLETANFAVLDHLSPWRSPRPRRASVNSLGVGGTNAHVIMESAPVLPAGAPDRDVQLFPLSARSPRALKKQAERLLEHTRTQDQPLPDVAWTLQVGRRPFELRTAVAAKSKDGLRAELKRFVDEGLGSAALSSPTIAMMFSGGGAAHAGMGRGLYESEPVYREIVDRCCAASRDQLDYDLMSLLLGTDPNVDIERPTRGLPSLFVTQYACAGLWQSMGIEPSALIGHSVGEYAAACVAGVMSLEDGLRMVIRRGELFEELPAGAMLSVVGSEKDLEAHLTPGLSLAVHNAPELSVVSGPVNEIEALADALPGLGFDAQRVPIQVAAHSSMLDPILPEFRRALENVSFQPPRIPIVSNLTGEWLSDEAACDPDYWVRQLRGTVRFADGLDFVSSTANVFLEAGPGTVLSSLVTMQPFFGNDQRVVHSMRHPKDDMADDRVVFYRALGDVWATGVDIDWTAVHDHGPRRRVPLPTYPFDHQRHWVAAGTAARGDDQRLPVEEWFHQPVWEPGPGPLSRGDDLHGIVVAGDVDETLLGSLGDSVEVRAAGSVDNLEAALAELPTTHQWTLLTSIDNGDSGPRALEQAITELHEHAVAVGSCDGKLARWRILVRDAAPHGGSEENTSPVAIACLAAARVIGNEMDVGVRCVDMAGPIPTDHLLDSLLESDDRPLALRGRARFVLEHRPMAVPDPATPRPPQGCCVITGGLGDLALEFATTLAAEGMTAFALVARRGLPSADDHDFFVSEGGTMARRMRAVDDLRARGARVVILSADVSDPTAMDQAWESIEEQLGPIGLVLHTAGSLDDGVIGTKSLDEIRRVLEPKAAAAGLVKRSGAHFVLFSSTSAIAGVQGQFAYAAANGYLDGLALRARGEGEAVLSVGWGAWKDTGMAARLLGTVTPEREPPHGGVRTRNGLFERVVSGSEWVVSEHRTRAGTTLMPGTGLLAVMTAARGDFPVGLRHVALLQPLLLGAGERRVMQVEQKDDRITLRSAGTAEAAEREDWLGEHVEAEAFAPPAENRRLDIPAIRSRCERVEALVDRTPVHAQMSFGARWTCLDGVRYGVGEALVEVSLDSGFSSDLDEWSVHPALLDVATGAAQKLLPDFEPARDFFVPQSYAELVVYSPMPGTLVSHVRVADSSHATCSFDVTVADSAGNVVLELRGFRLKRMPASVLDSLVNQSVEEFDAETTLDPLKDAIRSDEGLPLLARLLAGVGAGPVVVSPLSVGELRRRVGADTPTRDGSATGIDQADRPEISTTYVEPGNEVERAIAEVWREALGFSSVGIDDNFFTLGGHSLLLTKVASRVRKKVGLSAPLSDLFETPTISYWASMTSDKHQSKPTVAPIGRASRAAYAVSE